MSDNATTIETLFEKAENYGRTSVELLRLKAIGKSADVFSSLAIQLVITIAVAILAICLNIALALWIGELLGKSYYGFLIIAGAYAFITVVLYIFRYQLIKKPVSNAIIIQMQQKTI
ncbi:hypothetical protein ACQ33O_03795 [Ferruginibacter sp. SUN002]|uniref:hypothetical protein n=1 Tax=Ferruginibacter sp. SUN002 TaxID=2937789 RepID=UPI003D35FE45